MRRRKGDRRLIDGKDGIERKGKSVAQNRQTSNELFSYNNNNNNKNGTQKKLNEYRCNKKQSQEKMLLKNNFMICELGIMIGKAIDIA